MLFYYYNIVYSLLFRVVVNYTVNVASVCLSKYSPYLLYMRIHTTAI